MYQKAEVFDLVIAIARERYPGYIVAAWRMRL